MSMPAESRTGAWERFAERVRVEVVAGLPEHVGRRFWGSEQIKATQEHGLRNLLAHAVEHSPYHRRRLAGFEIGSIDLAGLSRLPVMDKADMMAGFDGVLTDRSITRAMVEGALESTGSTPVPIGADCVAFATGGSSGARGVLVFDVRARAGFIRSLLTPVVGGVPMSGPARPGASSSARLSIAVVAAASAVHSSGAIAAAAERGAPGLQVHQVPVTLPVPEIVQRLNEIEPRVLVGYPSILGRLSAERRAGTLKIAPIAITSMSETLAANVREAISDAFGVAVVDVFASTEGLVGSSAPGDSVFVFNDDMCIIELVDDDNQPVAPGVPSAKVLLTNLYNLLHPLIRYELSDVFIRQPDASEHGHLRALVRGRADEVLRYGDLEIHPHLVRSVLLRHPRIPDYQVRQTPRGVDLDVIADSDADLSTLTDQLLQALEGAGLKHPSVRVRTVRQLPRHPETGKLSRFVPLTSR